MKKNDIEKIFKKLDLKMRSTIHNYGWLVVNGRKILRVHYSLAFLCYNKTNLK